MIGGEAADAPTGFNDMCARDAVLCDAGMNGGTASAVSAPASAPSSLVSNSLIFRNSVVQRFTCTMASLAPTDRFASALSPRLYPYPYTVGALSSFAVSDVTFVTPIEQPIATGCAALDRPAAQTGNADTYLDQPTGALIPAVRSPSGPVAGTLTPQAEAKAPADAPQLDNAELEAMLKHINRKVNQNVVQVSDMTSSGEPEFWRRAGDRRGSMGDCEDIAIEKRMELIEAGFPPQRLFFAVAYSQRYGLHTLLIAHLDSGDVVLDSLSPRILPWAQTPYIYLRRQSADNPRLWQRIDMRASRQSIADDAAFTAGTNS